MLGVVEAMKMELALKAPYDGVVTAVTAVTGAQVALGDALFTVRRSRRSRSDRHETGVSLTPCRWSFPSPACRPG